MKSCQKYRLVFFITLLFSAELISKEFTILYSSNNLGEILPCGCASSFLGGMERRSNFINEVIDDSEGPVFLIDGGNLLFNVHAVPKFLETEMHEKAKLIGTLMHEFKYDAIGIGINDLAAPTLFNKMNLPFISTNLNGSEDVFRRSRSKILSKEGVHVAILSFISDVTEKNDKELTTTSFEMALASELKNIQNKHHLIVLLSNAGKEIDKTIVSKFPIINFVIGYDPILPLGESFKVGDSYLMYAAPRGTHMGQLTIYLDDLKKNQSLESQLEDWTKWDDLESTLEWTREELNGFYSQADLKRSEPINKLKQAFKDELPKVNEIDQIYSKIQTIEKQLSDKKTSHFGFVNRTIKLTDEYNQREKKSGSVQDRVQKFSKKYP